MKPISGLLYVVWIGRTLLNPIDGLVGLVWIERNTFEANQLATVRGVDWANPFEPNRRVSGVGVD